MQACQRGQHSEELRFPRAKAGGAQGSLDEAGACAQPSVGSGKKAEPGLPEEASLLGKARNGWKAREAQEPRRPLAPPALSRTSTSGSLALRR